MTIKVGVLILTLSLLVGGVIGTVIGLLTNPNNEQVLLSKGTSIYEHTIS